MQTAHHGMYRLMIQPNGGNSGFQMTYAEECCRAKLAPRTSRLLLEKGFDPVYTTEFFVASVAVT